MQDIENGVAAAVAKVLKRPQEAIPKDGFIMGDLKADSLHQIEIVMELEDVFGIAISDEEAEAAPTLAQVRALVQRKVMEVPANG